MKIGLASNDNSARLHPKIIWKMTREEAINELSLVRWGDRHEQACPKCGVVKGHYWLEPRTKWKCVDCAHQFSIWSGTFLAGTKMSPQEILALMWSFAGAAKGMSSLQMARAMSIEQKSAFNLVGNVRQALTAEVQALRLSGIVEVDGATFGGHRRMASMAKSYVDGTRRRYAKKVTHERCVIVVMRERGGRTVPVVVDKESQAFDDIKRVVEVGSIIQSDGARAWDSLRALYDLMKTDHMWTFAVRHNHTNNAESFFARMRKMHNGTHHKISKKYMIEYASEMAWRTDHALLSCEDKMIKMLSAVLQPTKTKRTWRSRSSEVTVKECAA